METKINIAEILKDKPQGTKLYSPLFGNVYLLGVENGIIRASHHGKNETLATFYRNGKYFSYPESEPLLFPSKEMRDWSKFAWKKGDVLVSNDSTTKVIFNGWTDDTYTLFRGAYAVTTHNDGKIEFGSDSLIFETCNYKGIEVEDDAQFYINYIERKLGGKLNLETLEIEKAHPEFKDGDIVLVESHMLGINTSLMIAIFRKEKEIDKYKFCPALCKSNVHDTYLRETPVVLSPSDIKTSRPATDSERQQLFDALAKEGKAWDRKKKMIVDLKLKHKFKPFDKIIVLERFAAQEWVCDVFSHYSKDYVGKEIIIGLGGCTYYKALPFNEETAKLLGTTKDVEG